MPVKANISNVLEWKYFVDPEVDNFFVAEQIDMINKFGCIEINLMNKLYTNSRIVLKIIIKMRFVYIGSTLLVVIY